MMYSTDLSRAGEGGGPLGPGGFPCICRIDRSGGLLSLGDDGDVFSAPFWRQARRGAELE